MQRIERFELEGGMWFLVLVRWEKRDSPPAPFQPGWRAGAAGGAGAEGLGGPEGRGPEGWGMEGGGDGGGGGGLALGTRTEPNRKPQRTA